MSNKCEEQAVQVFGYGTFFALVLLVCLFSSIFWLQKYSMNSRDFIAKTKIIDLDSINQKLDLIIDKLDKLEK
jgi:hypothetical protein